MVKMKKKKIRYDRIIIAIIILGVLVYGGIKVTEILFKNIKEPKEEKVLMLDFTNKSLKEADFFFEQYSIIVNKTYQYDDNITKDNIISQSVIKDTDIKNVTSIDIVISLGKLDKDKLAEDKIDELGNIPVMMYHKIVNKTDAETKYTGGNVDKDGYNRTTESFRKDLEFYYQNDYRMIRLIDYINGEIDVEYGKSPIVLTFDDGNEDNIKVTGLDEQGNIIIDPNSAVGILESFKTKYPDFHPTATFFVNEGLFQQSEYNEKILNWLVENGYDIGNHTKGHVDFSKINTSKSEEVVGYIYNELDKIIPDKYVNVVALPFGSPYKKSHENISHILNSTYEGKTYQTVAALRVGWEADYSPFNTDFDKTFIKRCRAYDNNGEEFDIEMNFNLLKNKKYISDGNKNIIVIPESKKTKLIETTKEVITY